VLVTDRIDVFHMNLRFAFAYLSFSHSQENYTTLANHFVTVAYLGLAGMARVRRHFDRNARIAWQK